VLEISWVGFGADQLLAHAEVKILVFHDPASPSALDTTALGAVDAA
jgi:hypothetical protein